LGRADALEVGIKMIQNVSISKLNKIGYRWIPDMMRYDEFMESLFVLLKCQRFGQNKMPLALHSFA
jgi:hypothetical protein